MTAEASAPVLGIVDRPVPRRFAVAAALASLVVPLGFAVRLLAGPVEPPRVWLTPLVASAALVIGLLARRRAPGLAWPSLVAASLLASTIPIAVTQLVNERPHTPGEWFPSAVAVAFSAIATAIIAALHATRKDRRLGDWVVPVVVVLAGWLVAALALVVVLVSAGMRADPALTWADVATLPTTLYIHLVLILAALGVAADVRPALRRADLRLAEEGTERTWGARLRATWDELLPGLTDRQERDVEAERRRLAGDLHADVLPLLRRAIAEAEAGAGAETLATRLRAVDVELERLLEARWPVVLETFGLIEALEDLAERIEAVGLAVEIDVLESKGRPPGDVERVAYRIAQIALDNTVRHAGATRVQVAVSVTARRLALSMTDDGMGFDAAAAARGRRGLVDAAEQASRVGGRLAVASADDGTSVLFGWPESGDPPVRRDG